MQERKQYEMTDAQFERLYHACRPRPYVTDSQGNMLFGDPVKDAERVWQELGNEMGFKWDTAQPVPGANQKVFSAVPLIQRIPQ